MAIQGHIHLSSDLGTAPENAPDIKWKVHNPGRSEQIMTFSTVEYGLTGEVRPQVLLDDSLAPVKRRNFGYQLFLKNHDGYTVEQRQALLEAMVNTYVYLVDVHHPADGQDHTTYVRRMYFDHLGEFLADHVQLAFHYVDIRLLEAPEDE